jgi:hypothetical protein
MKSLITLPVTEGHVWHRVHSELIIAAGSFLVGWISGVAAVSRNKQKTNQGKGRRKGRRGWWLTSTLLAVAE